MLLIVLATGDLSQLNNVTVHQWLVFLIIVFTTGGTAIFLYYWGLRWVTASVSTICELAFPLTAIVLEYVLRGNLLSWAQWLGAVVLAFSIYKVSIIKSAV
jgi:drug/metabolite transporter (DMT)-like permease